MKALILLIVVVSFGGLTVSAQADETNLHKYNINVRARASNTILKAIKEENQDIEKIRLLRELISSGLIYTEASKLYLGLPEEMKVEFQKFKSKAATVEYVKSACDDVDTYMLTAYTHIMGNTISLCDQFWSKTPREQLNTLIHEILHTLGYGHDIAHSRRLGFYYMLIAPSSGKKKIMESAYREGSKGVQEGLILDIINILYSKNLRRLNKKPINALEVWRNYFSNSSCLGADGCREPLPGVINY